MKTEYCIWWTNASDMERSKFLLPVLPKLKSLTPGLRHIGGVFMVTDALGLEGQVIADKAYGSVSRDVLAFLQATHKGMIVTVEDGIVLRSLPGFVTRLDGSLWMDSSITMTIRVDGKDIQAIVDGVRKDTTRMIEDYEKRTRDIGRLQFGGLGGSGEEA